MKVTINEPTLPDMTIELTGVEADKLMTYLGSLSIVTVRQSYVGERRYTPEEIYAVTDKLYNHIYKALERE